MFEYDFMRMAFAAATCVATIAGPVGYFLVLRGQTFAGHALAHVGFAGATGAVLLGLSPITGLLALTLLAGFGMGQLGVAVPALLYIICHPSFSTSVRQYSRDYGTNIEASRHCLRTMPDCASGHFAPTSLRELAA